LKIRILRSIWDYRYDSIAQHTAGNPLLRRNSKWQVVCTLPTAREYLETFIILGRVKRDLTVIADEVRATEV
jgi:hypothetical protein